MQPLSNLANSNQSSSLQNNAEEQHDANKLKRKRSGEEKVDSAAKRLRSESAAPKPSHEYSLARKLLVKKKLTIQEEQQLVSLLKEGAEKRCAKSANSLGVVFSRGIAGNVDLSQAFTWFKVAADLGVVSACHRCGDMLSEGTGVAQDLTAAVQMWKKASLGGNLVSGFNYAQYLYAGDHVNQDKEQALQIFRRCAFELDFPQVHYRYALMLSAGEGVEKNPVEAVNFFEKASAKGHPQATLKLAEVYRTGTGAPTDQVRALQLYKLAYEAGQPCKSKIIELLKTKLQISDNAT